MSALTRVAQSAYRAVTPFKARRFVDNVRHLARLKLFGGTDGQVRYHRLLLWQDLGRHVVPTRLADGTRLWVDLRDGGVGVPIFCQGAFEPDEVAFLAAYLRPGMTVVDVGANIGYHALKAGKLVGPTGRVLAFEPDPHNFDLLNRNVRANRLRHVHPVRCALGDKAGTLRLYHSDDNFGDHRLGYTGSDRRGVDVAVRPLDAVLAEERVTAVDLFKIDVQGYEWHVFAGMTRTLNATPPATIMMEYWPAGMRDAGGDPDRLLDTLAGLGYRFHLIGGGGRLSDIRREDVDRHIPPDPARPDGAYVNLVLRKG